MTLAVYYIVLCVAIATPGKEACYIMGDAYQDKETCELVLKRVGPSPDPKESHALCMKHVVLEK